MRPTNTHLTMSALETMCDEPPETSGDPEVNHAAEDIGYLVIPTGLLSTSSSGASAGVQRSEVVARRNWTSSERHEFAHRAPDVDVRFALLAAERPEWLSRPHTWEDLGDFRWNRSQIESVDSVYDDLLALDFESDSEI